MVSILAFIVLLGVIITVHESGHFIVAKLAGVKVEVFSIGFGKPIVSFRKGDTEYRIAWLPLGGYVRMLGDVASGDPTSPDYRPIPPEERERSLSAKPPLVRIAIYAAGPAMNLLLPFVILVPLFATSERFDQVPSSKIGAVDQGLPAYRAGLREGDEIVAINGEKVATFWQVAWHIDHYDPDDGPLKIDVTRMGNEGIIPLEVRPERIEQTQRLLKFTKTYYRIGYQPLYLAPDISLARPDGPLAAAGVQTFDRILAVGATETPRFIDVERALKAVPPGTSVPLKIERDATVDDQLTFLAKRETQTRTYTGDGLADDLAHAGPCITSVAPDSPAGAVLQRGDCILAVDGAEHTLGAFVGNRLTRRPEQAKTLRVRRAGQILTVTLEPKKIVRQDPMAGEIEQWQLGLVIFGRPDALKPLDTVENVDRWSYAWNETKTRVGYEIELLLNTLGGMFTGRVSATQLSGPITIFRLAGEYARAGIDYFLKFMILLSLSIGIINLLPVPVLDGGQIMVAATELIIRRPLPDKVQEMLLRVGVVLVLGLIVFAITNDLVREWRLTMAE